MLRVWGENISEKIKTHKDSVGLINPQQVVSINNEGKTYTIKMTDGNIITGIEEIEESEFKKLHWDGDKPIIDDDVWATE